MLKLVTMHGTVPRHALTRHVSRDTDLLRLDFVNRSTADSAAGAYFAEDGLKYCCVAGRSVRGHGRAPRRSISRYAYGSYKQVLLVGGFLFRLRPSSA